MLISGHWIRGDAELAAAFAGGRIPATHEGLHHDADDRVCKLVAVHLVNCKVAAFIGRVDPRWIEARRTRVAGLDLSDRFRQLFVSAFVKATLSAPLEDGGTLQAFRNVMPRGTDFIAKAAP